MSLKKVETKSEKTCLEGISESVIGRALMFFSCSRSSLMKNELIAGS